MKERRGHEGGGGMKEGGHEGGGHEGGGGMKEEGA